MIDRYKDRIVESPLFHEESHDEILAALGEVKVREFSSGEYICREGEYDENCCIILSGQVSVVLPQKRGARGKRFILSAGEVFGEIAALSGNPRTADIVAAGSAVILNIPRSGMFRFILIPVSCRSCEDPTCMSGRPTGAISRDSGGDIYHKVFVSVADLRARK